MDVGYASIYQPPFDPADKPYRFAVLDIARDWGWVKSHVGCHLTEDSTGIIAVDRDGNYAAACVMDNWTGNSVNVHFAILNPFVIKYGFFNEIAEMVFVHARRGIMIGLVPASNEKALKLDLHIGFTELFRIKDGYDHGVDYIVMELRRENCRWIRNSRLDG